MEKGPVPPRRQGSAHPRVGGVKREKILPRGGGSGPGSSPKKGGRGLEAWRGSKSGHFGFDSPFSRRAPPIIKNLRGKQNPVPLEIMAVPRARIA